VGELARFTSLDNGFLFAPRRKLGTAVLVSAPQHRAYIFASLSLPINRLPKSLIRAAGVEPAAFRSGGIHRVPLPRVFKINGSQANFQLKKTGATGRLTYLLYHAVNGLIWLRISVFLAKQIMQEDSNHTKVVDGFF
jgi:hypothetical protein